MNRAQRAAKACVKAIARTKYSPDYIIDFGIGIPTEVHFFKTYWPKAKLIGIDPLLPYDVSVCDIVLKAAIRNTGEETTVFYEWNNLPCSSSLWPSKRAHRNIKREVPVIKLDYVYEVADLTDKKIFIWADCEGAELEAFQSGPRLMAQADWLQVEVTPVETAAKYPGIPYMGEVHDYLVQQRFELFQETGRLNARHDRTYKKCR